MSKIDKKELEAVLCILANESGNITINKECLKKQITKNEQITKFDFGDHYDFYIDDEASK